MVIKPNPASSIKQNMLLIYSAQLLLFCISFDWKICSVVGIQKKEIVVWIYSFKTVFCEFKRDTVKGQKVLYCQKLPLIPKYCIKKMTLFVTKEGTLLSVCFIAILNCQIVVRLWSVHFTKTPRTCKRELG